MFCRTLLKGKQEKRNAELISLEYHTGLTPKTTAMRATTATLTVDDIGILVQPVTLVGLGVLSGILVPEIAVLARPRL